jgi:predicted GNAT family acetyltransferase
MLYVQCFNIGHFDARYHGKGIASAMLHELVQWAKENGWRRLEIASCLDVVPFWALGPHVLRRSVLERRGFRLAKESACPPKEADFRRKAIVRILTEQFKTDDWDAKTYPDNIAHVKRIAETSDWQAILDRDYVMACDIQGVDPQECPPRPDRFP